MCIMEVCLPLHLIKIGLAQTKTIDYLAKSCFNMPDINFNIKFSDDRNFFHFSTIAKSNIYICGRCERLFPRSSSQESNSLEIPTDI